MTTTTQAATPAEPIRLLLLSSNPDNSERLRIDRELQEIRDKLRSTTHGRQIQLEVCSALRVDGLQKALLDVQPHIVHFSGHGTDTEEILLEDQTGNAMPVGKEALVELFGILKDSVRVIVLNACHTRALARALTEHVDCAIGMSRPIVDRDAIDFAAAFYQALGSGRSVQDAFELGKNQLKILNVSGADTPECFWRAGLEARSVVLVHAPTAGLTTTPAPASHGGESTHVLLLLDLATDNPIWSEQVWERLPGARGRRVTVRMSELDVRPTTRGSGVDWEACADAVLQMARKARASAEGQPVHFYVAGRAALPIFAHLGMELAAWADVTLINRRKDGSWDVLPLQGPRAAGARPFFTEVRGLDTAYPSDAEGRVAVFISTYYAINKEQIYDFIHAQGDSVAGVVDVHTGAGRETLLDDVRAPDAAGELTRIFTSIKVAYPRLTGVALFIAGPSTLAFMAGRAINVNILGDVWVPNHGGGSYHAAAKLPWKSAADKASQGSAKEG